MRYIGSKAALLNQIDMVISENTGGIFRYRGCGTLF